MKLRAIMWSILANETSGTATSSLMNVHRTLALFEPCPGDVPCAQALATRVIYIGRSVEQHHEQSAIGDAKIFGT